MKVCGVKS